MSHRPLDETTEEEMSKLLRALLSQRHAASEREHEENAVLAEAISGHPQARERALALIATSPEIAEAMLLLPAGEARRDARPRRRLAVIGLIAAGLAGSLALAVLSPTREEAPSTMSPKGDADRLIVAVDRAGRQFRAQPGQVLMQEDRLGFFYSTERAGYVAVFARDSGGMVTIIHPVPGEQSAPVERGREIPLSGGAVADVGSGCEWAVAVFSDEPLDLARLKDDIRQGSTEAQQCTLKVNVSGARSISVVPFLR